MKRKIIFEHVSDMYEEFGFCIGCRFGYPDFTYLSRVRSELAAKGISSASTSSTSVASSSSPKPATTDSALHNPAATKMSTRMSSKAGLASSHSCEPTAASTHTAHYHSDKYDSSNQHCGQYSPQHVEAALSSPTASATRNTGRYGMDRTTYSVPHTLPGRLAMNTTYPVEATVSLDSVTAYSSGRSNVSYSFGERSSRHDDHVRQQVSRLHHSSHADAGVLDTNRRYH